MNYLHAKMIVMCYLLYFFFNLVESSNANFKVIKWESCNKTQGVIKLHTNVTQDADGQFLNLDMDTPVAWDDNLGAQTRIEANVAGLKFLELHTIREKNACKSAQKYMDEFWYDIVAHTGHPNPRGCPILPGRYHVNHMQLNFNKLTLQTFPFGILRFITRTINNKNPEIDMGCLLIEVENMIN